MKYTVTADAEAEISLEGEHEHAKATPRTVVEVRRGDAYPMDDETRSRTRPIATMGPFRIILNTSLPARSRSLRTTGEANDD